MAWRRERAVSCDGSIEACEASARAALRLEAEEEAARALRAAKRAARSVGVEVFVEMVFVDGSEAELEDDVELSSAVICALAEVARGGATVG